MHCSVTKTQSTRTSKYRFSASDLPVAWSFQRERWLCRFAFAFFTMHDFDIRHIRFISVKFVWISSDYRLHHLLLSWKQFGHLNFKLRISSSVLRNFASFEEVVINQTRRIIRKTARLPHRLSKRQSPTTVLLRTPVNQMIIFNHDTRKSISLDIHWEVGWKWDKLLIVWISGETLLRVFGIASLFLMKFKAKVHRILW